MTSLVPHRLAPDNLTPPTRTPWGGTRIANYYKAHLGLPAGSRVGEAWEVSVEPSFPSRLAVGQASLAATIAADPVGWLGASVAARFQGQLPLLMKLLDAAEDLSVQVHPTDEDLELAPQESGKPEAWIILDAKPGAGIFLGWRDGVDRAAVEACLAEQGALDVLMNFVPVAAGEVYSVDAGVPHAIGAGVTLVEPQQVLPGKMGVTYRFWDWNRRYDENGRPSADGEPRSLHVDRALAVSRWTGPQGGAFVALCRRQPRSLGVQVDFRRDLLIDGPHFWVERWAGSGTMWHEPAGFLGIVCVQGALRLRVVVPGEAKVEVRLQMGESAVVPAGLARMEIDAESAEAYVGRPLG